MARVDIKEGVFDAVVQDKKLRAKRIQRQMEHQLA